VSGKLKTRLIITIDGPSGAGKSTVAKMLASALNYKYIDTGAMYRGVAYAYMKELRAESEEHGAKSEENKAWSSDNEKSLEGFLKKLSLRFEFSKEAKVYLDGEDISNYIRDQKVSMLASYLSQKRSVREYLTNMQKEIGRGGGVVLEGRDTGSVVFPDAHIKFYLDAKLEERAKRRYLELSSRGVNSELLRVKEEILKRDKVDSERDISPLVIPEDAIYIDTTEIDAFSVVEKLLNIVRSKEYGVRS
jgi:cytidylate kinase